MSAYSYITAVGISNGIVCGVMILLAKEVLTIFKVSSK